MPFDGTGVLLNQFVGSNGSVPPPTDHGDPERRKPEKPDPFKICARTVTGTLLLAAVSYAAHRSSTGLGKVTLVETAAFAVASAWMEHTGKNYKDWQDSGIIYKMILPCVVALLPAAASLAVFHNDFNRSPVTTEVHGARPHGQCQPTARFHRPSR